MEKWLTLTLVIVNILQGIVHIVQEMRQTQLQTAATKKNRKTRS